MTHGVIPERCNNTGQWPVFAQVCKSARGRIITEVSLDRDRLPGGFYKRIANLEE